MKNWKTRLYKFMGAQTISLFGSSLVQYAIIWHITLTTSSGVMMTLATICGYVPQILISLFAGVWIDRYHRKYMIMLSDTMIAISTLIIALIFLNGYGNVWWLFVVLIIRSVGTGIQTPAVNAIIPQLVPKENLMKVNGIQSTITSLTMFLSPAMSGAILSFLPLEAIFFIDIITYIIANLIMLRVKVKKIIVKDVARMMDGIHGGFLYLKQNILIQRLLAYLIVVMIFISPAAFLTPLLVTRSFGIEVWRLSLSEMTFSMGAMVGGIVIASWGGFKNKMHTVILMTILYGSLMLFIGVSPIFIIYLLCNFLIGITMPCFNAPINVLIQEKVETAMQGRIFSIIQIANSCALPIGTILFGPLADFISVQYIFLLTGSVVIGIGIFVLFTHKLEEPLNK